MNTYQNYLPSVKINISYIYWKLEINKYNTLICQKTFQDEKYFMSWANNESIELDI